MKRLYRVTWVDGYYGTTHVRHYQSKAAAEHRANVLREGFPEEEPTTGQPDDFGRPALPPSPSVRIDVSDPITFPADQDPS